METDIDSFLAAARKNLVCGLKLSKQASYHRRAPAHSSLPFLNQAGSILNEVLRKSEANLDALTMASLVSECLMDFVAAIAFQMRAFEAGQPKSKKLLKRLARLRENEQFWKDLPITPEKLNELGEYLESNHVGPNDRTLRLTREWIKDNAGLDANEVIDSLGVRGGFSDYQILVNVVRG